MDNIESTLSAMSILISLINDLKRDEAEENKHN